MSPKSPGLRTGIPLLLVSLAAVAVAGFWLAGGDAHPIGGAPWRDSNEEIADGDDNLTRGPGGDVRSSRFEELVPRGQVLVGRVEDPAGDPLPGSSIRCALYAGESTFGQPRRETEIVSDENGEFSIRFPGGSGTWMLTMAATLEGYICEPQSVGLLPGRPITSARLVAHPLDITRSIRIVDSGGLAVPEARITIEQAKLETPTDLEGRAQVKLSSSFGAVWVSVAADGMGNVTRRIAPWSGTGPQEMEIVLRPGRSVAGIVRDPDGKVLHDVVVRHVGWLELRTTTAADGRYRITGIPDRRRQSLTFRKPGYLPATRVAHPTGHDVNLDVSLERGVNVCGVVRGPDDEPLGGALVTVGRNRVVGRSRGTTDEQGRFCIPAPRRGRLTMRVSYPQHVPDLREIDITTGMHELAIRLVEGSSVGGRVLDEESRPIEGAAVSAFLDRPFDLGLFTETGPDGHWLLEGVPGGELKIRVDEYGYLSETKTVNVGRRNVDVILVRAGSFDGRVVDGDGQPVTRFRVVLSPASDGSGVKRPRRVPTTWKSPGHLFEDAEGRFSSGRTPLDPGRGYRIEVTADDYATGVIPLYVPSIHPRNAPVRIQLRSGAALAGRITDAQGDPVAGAIVAPRETFPTGPGDPDHGPQTFTDRNGRYLLAGLRIGPVDIEARHPDYLPSRRSSVTRAGRVLIEDLLLIGAGSIRVRIDAKDRKSFRSRLVVEPIGSSTGRRREIDVGKDGIVRVPWLATGMWRVSLSSSHPGLDGMKASVEVVKGVEQPVLFDPGDLTCMVLGSVTIDGSPATRPVDITLERVDDQGIRTRAGNVRTRPGGTFTFRSLEPARYVFEASLQVSGQRRSGSITIRLEPGETPVTLALKTR
ncbi:MAG: hypothetical protein CMJ18_23050 [Phycisphaeraceae bacterium]|nr:hypothetical protein [Phycisphaeraceae bacterium]